MDNNAIAPVAPVATPATSTPAVDVVTSPTSPVERAKRVTVAVPTTVAGLFAMARTVTPANIDAMVARCNPRAKFPVNGAGKNVGRFTSTRVQHFQNTTLLENVARKLTDVQILFVWRVEFPMATGAVFVADWKTGVKIVRGVRADFNKTGHGEPARRPVGFVSEPFVAKTK